ncbi:MAG: LPS assembly protein LptD [Nitrospinae bacterium]|nr:LPS assembly protein LptD [Nitrospinota bacterium]
MSNNSKFVLLKTHGLYLSITIFSLVLFWTPSSPKAQQNSGKQAQESTTTPTKSGEVPRSSREREASIAITADEIREDRERQRIIGRGAADIRYLGKRIRADHIEVQTSTRDGVATGNIVFQTADDRIVANRIEFNLDTERLVVFNARGSIGKTYYVTGRVIRRLSEDRYEVQGGTFTTCEGDLPDWAFGFERATFQIEGYAQLEAPTMTVKGVPAAFFPWAMLPIKTKRATGFLLPGIGSSNRSGFRFSPSFFWAINDSSDSTFGVDYFTKRGTRYKGEYRYAPDRDTSGQIAGRYLNDKIERSTIWDVRGFHRSNFKNIGANLHAVIDMQKRPPNDRSLEGDLLTRTRQATDTHVTFTQNLPKIAGQFQLGMRRREGLGENDGQLFQRAPDIALNIYNQRLGKSDFYFNLNSSFTNFRKTENEKILRLSRFHIEPSFSLRLETVPWLGLTPEIGFRRTHWTHQSTEPGTGSNFDDTQHVESGLSREMWFTNLHAIGPRYSKVYRGELGPFRDFKHILSFETKYQYSPNNDAYDRSLIIPLDSVDKLQHEHAIEYAIVNRVLTKLPVKDGFQTRQLFRYRISQTYDLVEARRNDNLDTKPKRPLSDITFRLESQPFSKIRLLQQFKYNPYDLVISEHSTGVFLDGGKKWYLNLDRTWRRQRVNDPENEEGSYLNFAGGLSLNENFSLEYFSRLNKTEKTTLEQSITMRYLDCCWGVELTLTDTKDKSEVFLGFSLIGLLESERALDFKNKRNVLREGGLWGIGSWATSLLEK